MILAFNFPFRLHIHQNIKVEHDPRETNFQNPDFKHEDDVGDLGLKIRYPRIMVDFYNLMDMKSKSDIGGKNSPITSTDPRFLGRSQYNHMKSVMKMRNLNFIHIYVSTYEVETVFNDRCVILGYVETTNILGLVSELQRSNLFISETESLFSMKTQIVEE